MTVNILSIGDIVGLPGIRFLKERLGSLKKIKNIRFTVVNGENANVVGITPKQADEIFNAGADVITLGNHSFTRWEMYPYLDETARILRPANYTNASPGRGYGIFDTIFGSVCVINLLGRYSLDSNTNNPFFAVEDILAEAQADITLVDMHAEATSEKIAMGRFLDSRVAAVWGTHTHVQTSDACVLTGGTGYISDLGMTGPINSVLGIEPEQSIEKFLGGPPRRYSAAPGPCKLECCVFTVDTVTGRCLEAEAMRIV